MSVDNEVQGRDYRKPENLKENMTPYWYETEREKNIRVLLMMASVAEITVSVPDKWNISIEYWWNDNDREN